MRRFLSFNDYFKAQFNEKVVKLSLDGGMSCPNRDGTLSFKGCLFCSEKGSGDFAGNRFNTIDEQINEQKKLLSKKWKSNKYIAYFQNFTNTYGDIDYLSNLYNYVISKKDIVGLSIATRADCLNNEVMKMLVDLNKKTFLWVELGLQTVNENTIKLINRGYSHQIFNENIKRLQENNIRFLTHLIFGLPYENREDFQNTVEYVKAIHPFGVKIHSLYIQKDSPIYDFYLKNKFKLLEKDEYVEIVCNTLDFLPKDIVIHRITGDPDKRKLVAPKWCADKLSVISSIDKELKNRYEKSLGNT
ncbi:TIGR01212 family radical SAM protein [Anaerosphaera multitolerans]|uniref:TIGR01212 family radical SAM protein n=1 Tax=Anaerosphaera multitolerans TaxID=2487351 RepID=A0A437S8N4_9FIRM|nr:TIGR01212 family radical SAM protein [Anaerosphaera multitolerans]RVU55372.1 TIGR01212 family radical SAM protein [Anaerosphaera multitolerans]